jgi:hypothetical protein
MSETFLMQLVGTMFGAALGGFAAWVAIKIDVALAKQTAKTASDSAQDAHERLDRHIDKCHVSR